MFLPQLRLFKYSTKKQFFLGIFKRKILREKERKHAIDQENTHTLSTMKKRERKNDHEKK